MDASEFNELAFGSNADLAAYYEVDQRTVRRWKSGEVAIPGAVAKLHRLRFRDDNAAALLGKDWAGFRFGRDGKLYVPGWRGGFDPHGIQWMFFEIQHVRHHEATIRALERRIQQLEQELIETTATAMRYRRLVSNEARLGLMLERIAG